MKKASILLVAFGLAFLFCSCATLEILERTQLIQHYSNKNNFIVCTGRVRYVNFTNQDILILGIDNIDPAIFSDTDFKIVGLNVEIAKSNHIKEEICVNDIITFVSDPEYFGDGYIMPIVGLSKDDKVYLDFDTGYEAYMDYLRSR